MRGRGFVWLTGMVLLAGAGAFFVHSNYLSHAAPTPTQAQESRPQSVAVEAAKVTIGEVIDDIRAVGNLQPNEFGHHRAGDRRAHCEHRLR